MDIKRVLHGYFRSLIFYFAWWWELVMRYFLFFFLLAFSVDVFAWSSTGWTNTADESQQRLNNVIDNLANQYKGRDTNDYAVLHYAYVDGPDPGYFNRYRGIYDYDIKGGNNCPSGGVPDINGECRNCPDGSYPVGESGECYDYTPESEKNYCETPEAQQAMDEAVRNCPNQSGSASCNHDTEQIEVTCSDDPGGNEPEEPGGEKPSKPGEEPGGGSGGGSGGDEGGIDTGNGEKPGGSDELPDLCRDNPEACLYPPDDPACVENPALCDVPVSDDLLANIRQVTAAIKEQHYNTGTVIKTNTRATANAANDILSSTVAIQKLSSESAEYQKNISNKADIVSDLISSIDKKEEDENILLKKNARDLDTRLQELNKTIKDKPNGGGSNFNPGHDANVEGALEEIVDSSKLGFCEKNPNHESCITKSAKASACEPFSCTGEPVLCQLLKIEYDEQCNKPDFKSVEGSLNKIVGDGEPSQLINPDPLDFTNPDTKYLSNGLKFSAKCPAPVKASVLGETIEFSYQPLCDLAILIRPFVIGISWVVAAFVVGRGVSNL